MAEFIYPTVKHGSLAIKECGSMREMVEKLAPGSVPYRDSQNLGETVRVRIML